MFLVSESAVYIWEYEQEDSIPIKWFEKSAVLNDCQIINAQTDYSGNWCYLSGISLKVSLYILIRFFFQILYFQNGKIEGEIQLYNEKKKVSQIIEGHAGNFFSLKYPQNEGKTSIVNIFTYVARTRTAEMKLHLFQIDPTEPHNHNQFYKKIRINK